MCSPGEGGREFDTDGMITMVVAVVLDRRPQHLLIDELPRRLLDQLLLVRQFEIHFLASPSPPVCGRFAKTRVASCPRSMTRARLG
jgi:hypothetical protein